MPLNTCISQVPFCNMCEWIIEKAITLFSNFHARYNNDKCWRYYWKTYFLFYHSSSLNDNNVYVIPFYRQAYYLPMHQLISLFMSFQFANWISLILMWWRGHLIIEGYSHVSNAKQNRFIFVWKRLASFVIISLIVL